MARLGDRADNSTASSPRARALPYISPTALCRSYLLAASGVLLLLPVLFLGACQDPSGVGLDVIGEEGADPRVSVVAADSVMLDDEADITGGFANSVTPTQSRILVGATMDALLGDASAFAYLDVFTPGEIPEGFRDRTIISATLRLVRDYVYGDSMVSVPLELHRMDSEWSPIGAPADTTFDAGALLVEATVAATDTLVVLDLPASWVTEYDAILRSDTLAASLDGFQLRLPDGVVPGAVMGFNTMQSSLRVMTAQDTVDYPLFEVFTHIERGTAARPPANRIVLRDGAGETLALTFPFNDLERQPLANAIVRLSVDPSVLDEPGFARALPETIVLFGRTEAGERVAILNTDLDETTNSYSFSSATLTAVIQEALLERSIFERFEISVLSSSASLDAIPLIIGPEPAENEADTRPRVALTLVP